MQRVGSCEKQHQTASEKIKNAKRSWKIGGKAQRNANGRCGSRITIEENANRRWSRCPGENLGPYAPYRSRHGASFLTSRLTKSARGLISMPGTGNTSSSPNRVCKQNKNAHRTFTGSVTRYGTKRVAEMAKQRFRTKKRIEFQ